MFVSVCLLCPVLLLFFFGGEEGATVMAIAEYYSLYVLFKLSL